MLSPELTQYLNTQEGLNRIRGNQAVYKSLLQSFGKKDFLHQLQTEIEQNDTEAAAKTAHSIKGTASNLSMPKLYQTAMDLEQRLKAGEDVSAYLSEYISTAEKTRQAVAATLEAIERGEQI